MSAAILQVCLALDVPQPGFHFPVATPTRASPICPCVIAPDVYQQSNHLNQHGGMFIHFRFLSSVFLFNFIRFISSHVISIWFKLLISTSRI